ncbi:hypothetical protein HPB52_024199 [Rhipicephalus sanguineus]|uniref:Kelch-like protein diablo n=1 Tax=Rhipicephalus sanguineus TaxID=34632 RepID=A0A9D4TCR2_RHISA|nr:hypothetical protein HPB52_024199 [Rhipicephalus sanguineus]
MEVTPASSASLTLTESPKVRRSSLDRLKGKKHPPVQPPHKGVSAKFSYNIGDFVRRYSGCYALFALAKKGLSPEQKWLPPMRVTVEDLGSEMIQLLVDVAYRIPLCDLVGQHNIAKVLELAEKLELSQLLNHCVNFLKHDLQPESCIDNYHLASSRGYNYLASEVFRYLIRNFDQVWKSGSQFEALTPEEMRVILEDNRLHVPMEMDAFNALLKWISADMAERKAYLARFLPLVRLAWCSAAMWLTPRIPKHIIFVFGGWTDGATNRMITYNYRATRWRSMGNQYTSPRSYHGVAVINQCIYVVGGFNGRECFHSVVCFEVPLARWSAKANMAYPRCYGHIYAMGGYDGNSRIKTAERYNVKKNNWTEIASMNEYRSDASAAVARGRIYIAGGYTGFSVLDTVEFYDPSTDVWTHMQSMPWRRSGHKLLAYGDMIYIIGGSNGVARVSTLQQLDVQKHRYSELPSMPHAKSNFAAAILEGCIYIIGGFNGTTTVSLVEKYDIAPLA